MRDFTNVHSACSVSPFEPLSIVLKARYTSITHSYTDKYRAVQWHLADTDTKEHKTLNPIQAYKSHIG